VPLRLDQAENTRVMTRRWLGVEALAGHPGVVGIVASRLKEARQNRPSVVESGFEDGTGKDFRGALSRGIDLGLPESSAGKRGAC